MQHENKVRSRPAQQDENAQREDGPAKRRRLSSSPSPAPPQQRPSRTSNSQPTSTRPAKRPLTPVIERSTVLNSAAITIRGPISRAPAARPATPQQPDPPPVPAAQAIAASSDDLANPITAQSPALKQVGLLMSARGQPPPALEWLSMAVKQMNATEDENARLKSEKATRLVAAASEKARRECLL